MTSTPLPASSITDTNQRAASLCSAGQFAEAWSLVKPILEAHADITDDARADTLNIAGACSYGLRRAPGGRKMLRANVCA